VSDALRLWAARIAEAAGLQPGKTLLDVGAGGCALAAAVAAASGADVVAVDSREPPSIPAGVAFVRGSAAALPLPDRSVDAVLFSHVLHHVSRPELAVREAARVLAPGGRLVVRTASHDDIKASPVSAFMPVTLAGVLDSTPDLPVIIGWLNASGLRIDSVSTVLTPDTRSWKEFEDRCVEAGRRDWALGRVPAPDPADSIRSQLGAMYHNVVPPVRETLIVASRPDLPSAA
jgi:SAM-dependent methyltransferase